MRRLYIMNCLILLLIASGVEAATMTPTSLKPMSYSYDDAREDVSIATMTFNVVSLQTTEGVQEVTVRDVIGAMEAEAAVEIVLIDGDGFTALTLQEFVSAMDSADAEPTSAGIDLSKEFTLVTPGVIPPSLFEQSVAYLTSNGIELHSLGSIAVQMQAAKTEEIVVITKDGAVSTNLVGLAVSMGSEIDDEILVAQASTLKGLTKAQVTSYVSASGLSDTLVSGVNAASNSYFAKGAGQTRWSVKSFAPEDAGWFGRFWRFLFFAGA